MVAMGGKAPKYHARRTRRSRQPKELEALRIVYPTWHEPSGRIGKQAGGGKLHCSRRSGVLK